MTVVDSGARTRAVHWSPAILYEPSGRYVRCTVCPIGCRLADGQVGVCHVRRALGGGMQTATVATSVLHVNAVERKPLYHFRPGSRVVTLASPGCSFRCSYCINHRMSQFGREADVPWISQPVDPQTVIRQAAAQGSSVALSYTEPSLAIELTLALAEAGRPAGTPILWKSNGYLTRAARRTVAPALAAANIDVKAADEASHHRLTSASLAPVLGTVADFVAAGIWVEVSTPVIPGVNATAGELASIAGKIAAISPDIPWHLLRWTPAYRLTRGDPTTPEALRTAVRIGRDAGLNFVYVERALGPQGRNTDCPGCGCTLVQRGIWTLDGLSLENRSCPRCGQSIPGRW